MANEIEICNLALSRVGASTISSFDEATNEARISKIHYGPARDSVLRDHDWSFARKALALSLLSQTHPEWAFVYAYPPDCLAARRIFNSFSKQDRDAIAFDIGIADSGNTSVVLTDQADAILIYTSKVLNSVVYDAAFCDALAWRLAAEMVQPLRAEAALAQSLGNRYLQVLNAARTLTSNEQKKPDPNGSSYTDFRK